MPFIANRNSKKTCRRKGDDTLLGNPKPQSPENLSPRKFWRPWSDEVPDTEVLGCKTEISISGAASNLQHLTAGIGWWLWPLYLESHKLQDMVSLSGKACEKKKLVQQTIASRWWCVVTVRSLQTISRYAALWFWDLVCSATVRSLRVLGRSPVCRSFC